MSSNSGATAQDGAWKSREQAAEEQWARQREQERLQALAKEAEKPKPASRSDEIEGGYGGQEELEDRYATTSGEH
ncbi:hypothetical protein EXIGLDRAFT_727674 [Exidia glandulosa HHB12029]|uniref:ATPase inhibitor, mitochondrial n=1 Tax=Exidia glandulosa HHB12029 TaxID=1314781 RepID=A0A165D9D6_EXIGL|nr:hypothetical protein EXIGLDRAFT_727674 [Exidia glandulosa HHB12029]